MREVRRGFLGNGLTGRRGFLGGGFAGRGVLSVVSVAADPAMPIYVTAGAAAIGAGDVTPTMPAHQTGDFLLLSVLMVDANNATPATPAGWTKIADETGVAFASIYARLTVFYKIAASGSEVAPTIADGDTSNEAQIHVFRGASGFDSFTKTPKNTFDSAAFSADGHTTLGANRLIVIIDGQQDGNRNNTLGSLTNAALSDLTIRTCTNTADADLVTLTCITGGLAVAGPIGTTTGTWGGGGGNPYVAASIVISLKP